MTKQIVLKLLREHTEEFLSGEAISRQAGVSRAAVWKAVEQLRQEGYGIESVPNRGYRLTRVTARLRPEELAEQFRDCRIGRELLCFDTIDSTNNELKRRAVSGTVDGTVILADQQTGGRGRRGRSFVSPAGKGLYLSAALRPRCPLSEISTLTAWTAVALCDAVEAACGVRPGIKWPNDLVLNRKKLCGILTELEWEAESGEFSDAGSGGRKSSAGALWGVILAVCAAPIAISLAQALGTAPDRTELAAQVIRSLNALYDDFPAQNAAYLDHFRRDCLTVGNPIKVISGAEERIGTATGISDDLGLTGLWEDGSTEALTSGEVSVRGLYDYV